MCELLTEQVNESLTVRDLLLLCELLTEQVNESMTLKICCCVSFSLLLSILSVAVF